MSKEIPLTQGKVTIVDDDDYEELSKFKWFAKNGFRKIEQFYAVRRVHADNKYRQETVVMHRFILGAAPGVLVDHIDGNGLNNTRANLRLCNAAQNSYNKRSHVGRSGFKGVFFAKGRYLARITCKEVRIRLGGHDTAERAARAYDAAAKRLFGEFARLNFPDDPAS